MIKAICFSFLFCFLLSCRKDPSNVDAHYTYELSRLKVEYLNNRSLLIDELLKEYNQYNNSVSNLANTIQTSFLSLLKNNWSKPYIKFIQLHPYAYANSILQTDLNLTKYRFDINHINEGYLDSTSSSPFGGLINSPNQYPFLTNPELYHLIGDPKNASLGFHVIEFILWGEDTNLAGAPERTITDFSDFNQYGARRREFLRACSTRLKYDIEALYSFNQTNTDLKNVSAQDFIKILFNPIIDQLEDIATIAIKKPYDSQNKRDVICPPSDKSNEIIIAMLNSVIQYLDPYKGQSGLNQFSIIDFMRQVRSDLANDVLAKLIEARTNISDLQDNFEDAIFSVSERKKILAAHSKILESKEILKEFRNVISK